MNQLTTMAKELLEINDDLPYRMNHIGHDPLVDDFCLYMFEQEVVHYACKNSECLKKIDVIENVYVFIPKYDGQKCHVYFAGKYEYSCEYSDKLMEDVKRCCVASVMESGRYRTVCAE